MADQEKDIGALWTKEKNGKVYMAGTINGVQIVCFQNTYRKEGSNQPQWRVFKSRPRPEEPRADERQHAAHENENRGAMLGGRDDSDEIPF